MVNVQNYMKASKKKQTKKTWTLLYWASDPFDESGKRMKGIGCIFMKRFQLQWFNIGFILV